MATPTADELNRLKRMTGEAIKPTLDSDGVAFYTDVILTETLNRYLCDPDANGVSEFDDDGVTANADFVPVYDFHAAAGEIWADKAGAVAHLYTFGADGGNFSRSQWYDHCMKQARYHRSRRSVRTITAKVPYLSES